MNAAVEEMAEASVLLRNEPMARHTSWRVGGPAELYFRPGSLEDLQRFLRELPEAAPVHWVGLGSNLLVRDGGIRGAVIATGGGFTKRMERLEGARIYAGAGLPCATLARRAARWQLGPAAFFAGIPGTIGGALAMNAGAFGGETWERVERVETIDHRGVCRTRERGEFEVGYRTVRGPAGEWFLGATFALEHDPSADSASIRALLAKRGATQPLGQPSCGSVFRNPPGNFAGALIEQAGMKGARRGGAVVAEKHANFIINTGTATADDIEGLIEEVQAAVGRDSGIKLEPEVRILGERREPA